MEPTDKPPLRVVQLSDPHLLADRHGSLRRVVVYDQLRASVKLIQRLRPDVVVCTGDIAHDLSRQAYRLFREAIAGLNTPVLAVPGNHDDRAHMATELTTMCRALPSGHVVFRWQSGPWLLIGLDSQIPGEIAGELAAEQLAWLREEAVSFGPHGKLVLFMHHPPGSVASPWMDAVILRNRDLVAKALERTGVVAVFCGHTHFEHRGLVGNVPFYTTPATSFQFDRFQPVVFSREPAVRVIDLYEHDWFTQVWTVSHRERLCLSEEERIELPKAGDPDRGRI